MEAGAGAMIFMLIIGITIGDPTIQAYAGKLRYSFLETYALPFITAMVTLYGFAALRLRIPILLPDVMTGVCGGTFTVLNMFGFLCVLVGAPQLRPNLYSFSSRCWIRPQTSMEPIRHTSTP
jgi:hypothetical protein